ncbi:replication initiation protein [Amycolatopsis mongoliensis]|uniref:Replication initiation protein n=1 Tax=Amycolatopsis mongoliensis TaxID=715475 RepID=A0A9Y2NGR5_9PSEU|nr:replication initiator [Amycolatopsis sp. 4-36]WIY04427.1 replication initiation protein [Amycolatopsis sp. 4-36]
MVAAPHGLREIAAAFTESGTLDPGMAHVLARANFDTWADKVKAARGCAKPVRMAGGSTVVDSSGKVVAELSGSVFVPCKNRRASVCESCSAHYAHDTFHLIRAGMAGGKGVPETVTGHLRVLATLTAPSFGKVHSRPVRNGRVRRCSCGELHSQYDDALGTAVDPETYDYVGSVLWQAHAGELWRRFTIAVGRKLARALGIRAGELREVMRLSYAKVAEYQRRGLIHFHAVVRIDGPDGPEGPRPPAAVTEDVLTAVIQAAAASVVVRTPESPAVGVVPLTWGEQVDVEPIATSEGPSEGSEGGWHDRRVAGYVAKYATKGTRLTEGSDYRIRSAEHIEQLPVTEHHKQLMRTAWRLGGLVEFEELNLRKWAHMLGFRGHFLTKSRRYSTTFGEIRRTRAEYRLDEQRVALGIADDEVLTVVNDWSMTGLGYLNDAERRLAAVFAELHLARRRLDGQDDSPG